MRSRLEAHRGSIEFALAEGMTVSALARYYRVHHSTMGEFLGRRTTSGTERKRAHRHHHPLRAVQYESLRRVARTLSNHLED